ncbi:MAG: hypothetical protein K6W08_14870 [Firmicutes bacterium]|nr:hypothetical protein [Bacillota bacterium]
MVALDWRGRLLFRRRVLLEGDGVPARLLALHRAVDAALERSLAAILAIEKGAPGERIFTEAFAAWGQ